MPEEKEPAVIQEEIVTIMQGRPNSLYFPIIQPVPGIEFHIGQKIRCINPKTNKMVMGEVTEHYWIVDWDEPPRGQLIYIYGVEPELLRKVLLKTDPGFKDSWARLILIKETI